VRGGRPAPEDRQARSGRYTSRPSVVVAGRWVIHDATAKLCVRSRSTIRLFDSKAEADEVAERMNTARVVCVRCRHKVLLAECVAKVCARCGP
jgi:hypothetical protein